MRFSEAGGRTVAADINTMFNSVDTAILDAARLTASILETKAGSDVTPGRLQRVLDPIAMSLGKLIDSRKDMVSAHRTLVALKAESNLAVVDFGCLTVGTQTNGVDAILDA